jgi:hypothetical protein
MALRNYRQRPGDDCGTQGEQSQPYRHDVEIYSIVKA